MPEIVKVAVALIVNHKNEILISFRADDVHQGGLWEFPGGKFEKTELALDALKREMHEELNIEINSARLFKTIRYQYSDKTVELNIFRVESYTGIPVGAENQPIKWQPVKELNADEFPAANRSIILALQLPDKYMITGNYENHQDFFCKLEASLKKGISLVQLRSKKISAQEYKQLIDIASPLCKKYSAILLLNTNVNVFSNSQASGLHLSSHLLSSIKTRPIPNDFLLSVSCHTKVEIVKAKKLNADIILLSPVKKTQSHPGVLGIGWKKFTQISLDLDVPVYALGGMAESDLGDAEKAGAQGVAAISSFWG